MVRLRTRLHAVHATALLCALSILTSAVHAAAPAPPPAFGPRDASIQPDPAFAVGIAASDDADLPRPAARTESLDAQQILDITRAAVDLIGGMAAYVPADARTVLLKPNIVAGKPPGSGADTDARVVRAAAILVHEVAPQARILIAEGSGGWMSPSLKDCTDVEAFPGMLRDGFEIGGYRAVAAELRAAGYDIECYDLNFDRTRRLRVPGGGLARDEYDMPVAVLDADVWINLPVGKTHGTKITCAMKNHFGLPPATLYGWSKSEGTRNHAAIPHAPAIVDECWVDLWMLTEVDLNIVDMIRGTEAGAFAGEPKRANVIVAGRDPVATDLVVASLMGFNPDDFEFADLAWQRGRGPGRIERVDVRGREIPELAMRYMKAGVEYAMGEWGEHAEFGMGPRRWTLLGPLPRDHEFSEKQLRSLRPTPGRDGWSEVTFFGHDRIDLDKHFDDPVQVAVYAATRFTMPRSDSVRFWAGSDEDLRVWIDGALAYEHDGRRRHVLGGDKLHGYVEAGEHQLIVRAGQGRGAFEFSFNIAEPVDGRLWAGNTYPGLRYYVTPKTRTTVATYVGGDDAGEYFSDTEPRHVLTIDAPDPLDAWRSAPAQAQLQVEPPRVDDLARLALEAAGVPDRVADSNLAASLSEMPFGIAYLGFRFQPYARFFRYGPEPVRILDWLGLDYGLTYGFGAREAVKSVQGWIAGGRAPLVGYQGGWVRADGYRTGEDGVELHITGRDTSAWWTPPDEWMAPGPGGWDLGGAVLVVEAGDGEVDTSQTLDSLASAALEMGIRERYVYDTKPWGESSVPTGIAAWDEWVSDWERKLWTSTWASEPEVRGTLRSLGGDYLPGLASARELAARAFGTSVSPDLQAASDAFSRSALLIRELADLLPQRPSVEEGEPDVDASRLAQIAAAKPMVRRIRAAERDAFAGLARHLGQPALPVAVEDALKWKDRGRKLVTWHTDFNQGVYDLTGRGRDAGFERLDGRDCEGMAFEVVGVAPTEDGWTIAVEVLVGDRFYRVVEQPTEENGFTWRVRMDERFNRGGAPTDLVVWAIPVK